MITAATVTGAFSNLTRLHQLILEGTVQAVTSSGALQVNIGIGELYAGALVDTRFRAGDHVRMMFADDGTFQVIGFAPAGAARMLRTGAIPIDPGPLPTEASPTLHAALLRFTAKDNQALKSGRINAVLADGSLEVQLRAGAVRARAMTDQPFRAGTRIYAVRTDPGGYVVMGEARR